MPHLLKKYHIFSLESCRDLKFGASIPGYPPMISIELTKISSKLKTLTKLWRGESLKICFLTVLPN